MREAQRLFYVYAGAGRQDLLCGRHGREHGRFRWRRWRSKKPAWAFLRTRSSRTTTRQSIFITLTRIPRPAACLGRQGLRHHKRIAEPMAWGRRHPDDQPHLHRDFQDADEPQDPKRHLISPDPPPPRRAPLPPRRSCSTPPFGGRPEGDHPLGSRPVDRDDQHGHARRRHHPRHRWPGHGKAAYSTGKPALGVGAGNTPAIIDDTADVVLAVNSIIHSKTFDNG